MTAKNYEEGFRMKNIVVNGMKIAYREAGEGENLVLLHGGLSDSRYWERELDSFSDNFHVIVWDAPGCGQSDDPEEGFTLVDFADTLAGMLKKLNIETCHVAGISFGGGLAIQFYDLHPNMVKTLCLISAYAGWAGSLPQEEVERRIEDGRIISNMDPDAVFDKWMPTLFYAEEMPEIKEKLRSIMADFHPKGSIVMLEAFAQADLTGVLKDINVPTKLLYGEEDVRSPVEVATEIHNQIPDSKLVILPNVGHVVNLEAPEVFDEQFRQFLSQHI
jgi:pimeloyl-ACP methyl ester carboxylesterase